MGTMASQITSLTTVFSTVYAGADQIKFRFNGLCKGNSPMTGEFPHKGPVTRKMLPFHDVIMGLNDAITSDLVSEGFVDDTSTLAQVMGWSRTGDKPLFEPMRIQFSYNASLCLNVWNIRDIMPQDQSASQFIRQHRHSVILYCDIKNFKIMFLNFLCLLICFPHLCVWLQICNG